MEIFNAFCYGFTIDEIADNIDDLDSLQKGR